MSFYKHFKLPPFRLTQRCGSNVQMQSLHRNMPSQRRPTTDQSEDESCSEGVSIEMPTAMVVDSTPLTEPTNHEVDSQASVRGWNNDYNVRKRLLLAAVESNAMPLNQVCILCSELAVLRCQECGPLVHFCIKCFLKQHEKLNFFHIAEKWEVTTSNKIVYVEILVFL